MRKTLTVLAVLLLAAWAVNVSAADCVDIDLGAEVVSGEPLNILSVYFYAVNCGTEPGMVTYTVILTKDSDELGSAEAAVYMPAGKPFSKELELPIPPETPPGTYTMCVTAVLGEASDTACATVTIDSAGNVVGFQNLRDPAPAESTTWGLVKTLYQ